MPIQGFPDPHRHKICCSCGQWHEPYEGSTVLPPRVGPLAQIGRTLAGVDGFGLTERFMCHACQERQRRRRVLVWAAILAAILVVLLLLGAGLGGWLHVIRPVP